MKKPILLTGSHRSGTTWVGKIMSASNGVGYILEPFHLHAHRPGLVGAKFDYWFQYVYGENGNKYYKPIKNMLEFQFDLISGLRGVRSSRDFAKLLRDYYNCTRYRLDGSRPLVKEPTAIFTAPWFAGTFDADIIILIRHPAAFVSSLKILDWKFDFSNLIEQKDLMGEYLAPFDKEINEYARKKCDVLDQAILLWRIIHYTIGEYQKKYENWVFVRHEDLSLDPMKEFESLFSKLNLDFSEKVKERISAYSAHSNPSDTTSKNLILQSNLSLKRDSQSNIHNWKRRLTNAEINHIRDNVEDISTVFYGDNEW